MKKIISIISALTLGVCAFAKTSAELSAEFEQAKAEGWKAECVFFEANAADIATAWDAYKAAVKPTWDAQKGMFQLAYISGKVAMSGSDWQLCCLHAETFVYAKLADNPTFYTELKAANWTIGGNKMTQEQISQAAYAAKDFDYFKTAPKEAFAGLCWGTNGNTYKFFAENILAMTDVSEAKTLCNSIENALLLSGKNEEARQQVAKLNRALTARIIDSKLLK